MIGKTHVLIITGSMRINTFSCLPTQKADRNESEPFFLSAGSFTAACMNHAARNVTASPYTPNLSFKNASKDYYPV